MIERLLNEFLIQLIIENRQAIMLSIVVLAKESFEYWLGKTEKIKAGSTLELIFLILKKLKNVIIK
jgi:hypothetical protein